MSIRVVAGSAQAVVANDGHAWALRGNKFSIMWWDRIPIAAGITRAFQHATSAGTNRFIVGRGGGVIYLGVLWSAAADFNVTSGLADDGEWHCTQVVYDAGSTANVPTVYFDGVPQSVTVANAPTGSLPTPRRDGRRHVRQSAQPGGCARRQSCPRSYVGQLPAQFRRGAGDVSQGAVGVEQEADALSAVRSVAAGRHSARTRHGGWSAPESERRARVSVR